MTDSIRVLDNQRIDREDVEFLGDIQVQAQNRQLPENFLTNPAGSQLWIIGGFDITTPTTTQCRVTRGTAILNSRENGQIVRGHFAHEGDAQKTIDVSAYANGTYRVFIRFELIDSTYRNRIFWNQTALSEFVQNVPVRRAANWGMRIELASPSAEWFQIATVGISGGVITFVNKQRQFFFEGSEHNGFQNSISDAAGNNDPTGVAWRTWGSGANDRNIDRATYGIKDLQTFLAAVRVQISEIMGGGTQWFAQVPEALNNKVSRLGDSLMNGNYVPSFADTHSLGSATNLWLNTFTRNTHYLDNLKPAGIVTKDEAHFAVASSIIQKANSGRRVINAPLVTRVILGSPALRLQASASQPVVICANNSRIATLTTPIDLIVTSFGPRSGGTVVANTLYYVYARITASNSVVTNVNGIVYTATPPDASGNFAAVEVEAGFTVADYVFIGSVVTGDIAGVTGDWASRGFEHTTGLRRVIASTKNPLRTLLSQTYTNQPSQTISPAVDLRALLPTAQSYGIHMVSQITALTDVGTASPNLEGTVTVYTTVGGITLLNTSPSQCAITHRGITVVPREARHTFYMERPAAAQIVGMNAIISGNVGADTMSSFGFIGVIEYTENVNAPIPIAI
jgi:hypothetical protein